MGRGRKDFRTSRLRIPGLVIRNPKIHYLGVDATFTFEGRSNLSPIL